MTTANHLPALLLRLVFLLLLGPGVMLPWQCALAFEAPAFQGDVLDETGSLAEQDREALRERIRTLREADDIWAAVYIAHDLQQASIEEAAVDTFAKWKLGQKGKDNGVLVLVVPDKRKTRIEVGYGLEGVLTDALSRRIIAEVYVPAFREQRYAEGLQQGFDAMAKAKHGENALPDPLPEPTQPELNWDGAGTRFLLSLGINLLPVLIYAIALSYGRRHGRVRKSENDADLRTPLMLFSFFGLLFGIFYAVFGAAFSEDPEVMTALIAGNTLFAGVFSIPFGLKVRRFLSDKAYKRHQVRSSSSGKTASRDSSRWESSSSSGSSFSSDSDSSSSSSDGGSSGGGGASGDW